MSDKIFTLPAPAEKFVLHKPPMLLIDDIISVTETGLCSRVYVKNNELFSVDDKIPSWVAIEYMAQSIAAFDGFHRLSDNQAIMIGFLLGTRKFKSNTTHFSEGDVLNIYVEKILQNEDGMGVFDCELSCEEQNHSASARINVYQPPDQSSTL